MIKHPIFLLGIICIVSINCVAQKATIDSVEARKLVKKYVIKESSGKSDVNINLSKNRAIKIAKWYLYDTYGRRKIRKQMPFKVISIDEYWVIEGNPPTRKWGRDQLTGYFLFIINSRSGKVEHVHHTR